MHSWVPLLTQTRNDRRTRGCCLSLTRGGLANADPQRSAEDMKKIIPCLVFIVTPLLGIVSIADEAIHIYVMFRLTPPWPQQVQGTPESIKESFRPSLATNLALSVTSPGPTPLALCTSTFGTNSSALAWLFALKVYRYNPATTNYLMVHDIPFRDMRTNTTVLGALKEGDVLFYHGCVD